MARRTPFHEYQRRLKLLQLAQDALDKARGRGNTTKLANASRAVEEAKRGAAKAKLAAQAKPESAARLGTDKERQKAISRGSVTPTARRNVGLPAARDGDSGIRFSQDPDAGTRTVWAFRTGTSFHRRDCHVVEARDGAVQVSIADARKRNLERCMHCAPTVR